MNKEEFIRQYGEEAWQKKLARGRAYYREHRAEENARHKKYGEAHRAEKKEYDREYREENPEKAEAAHNEQNRKGGKRYDKMLEYNRTRLRGARNKIRDKHRHQYRPFKKIIAPKSQLHHEWIPETSEYRGVALVEADAHMHGFVDVIEILDGEITLLTEEEVKKVNGIKNETNAI